MQAHTDMLITIQGGPRSLLYVRAKIWVKSMHFCQIQHNFRCSEDLCELGNDQNCIVVSDLSASEDILFNMLYLTLVARCAT